MDRVQKLVVTLLIITVVLSVASIALNFALLNIDTKRPVIGNSPPESGNVQLVVEGHPAPAVGGSNG